MQFIKYPNFEFRKKTFKISESEGYFQIFLTHDNYKQKNGIQLELFYTSFMLGILHETKELNITYFFFEKTPNFEIKR